MVFEKCLHPCALGKSILSIGRVKFGLSTISESICPVMMYVFTHLSWCPIGVVTDQGEEPPPHLYYTVWGSVCLVMICVFTSLSSQHPAVWYPVKGMVGQGETLPIHHIPIEGWGLGRRYVWSYGSPYCGNGGSINVSMNPSPPPPPPPPPPSTTKFDFLAKICHFPLVLLESKR